MKVSREFNVALSELKLSSGESVADKLDYIKRRSVTLGQELGLMRQRKEAADSDQHVSIELTSDDYEELECMCWGIMHAAEEILRG